MGNREMEKEVKIRLTDELHARVKRVAQTNGQNITALVRFYIVQGLQTDEEKIHRFTEIGRGGPKIASEGQISHQRSSEKDNQL